MRTKAILETVATVLLIPALALKVLPSFSQAAIKMQTPPLFKNLVTGEVINKQLDPQALSVLTQVAKAGVPPANIAAKRTAFDNTFKTLSGPPEPILKVEDFLIPSGPGRRLPIRVYRPQLGVLPVLVYYHGGGFNKGDLNSHDAALRSLANRARCLIVAVDYRRTPESQYPAQIDDAFTALKWVAEHARLLGANPEKIAVGGDSVGGNLAAVTALRSRDQNGPKLVFQLLLYPVTDLTLSSESWKEFANGPWLTREGEYEGFHKLYLPAGTDPKQPYASPLFAPNLKGLPPALVVDGEFDPYRDEGQSYAKRLQAAGVPVTAMVYPGMIHDFFLMAGATNASKRLIQQSANALGSAFGSSAELGR